MIKFFQLIDSALNWYKSMINSTNFWSLSINNWRFNKYDCYSINLIWDTIYLVKFMNELHMVKVQKRDGEVYSEDPFNFEIKRTVDSQLTLRTSSSLKRSISQDQVTSDFTTSRGKFFRTCPLFLLKPLFTSISSIISLIFFQQKH